MRSLRRRATPGAVAALAAALLVVSCVPALPRRAAATSGTPPASGAGAVLQAVDTDATLTLPAGEPPTLDPSLASDAQSSSYLSEIYDGLVRFDADGVIQPALAARWDVSADGKRYTFHLRPDGKFQNGAPVTAEAFKYAIDRATDPALRSPVAGTYLGDIEGVAERLKGAAPSVSGVKVVDDQTLELDLVAPRSYFLAKLTYPTAFPLDAATVRNGGADWWQRPNGTGPFALASWDAGKQLVLQRFDQYPEPRPKLAKIVFVFNAPATQYIAAYQAGTFDMVPVVTDALPTVFADKSQVLPDVRVYDQPALTFLGFNTRIPPFDDPWMRRAVALSIDRAGIIHSALGSSVSLADSIIPPGIAGYDASERAYPYNPDLAKRAMANSRYAKSPPTVVLADAFAQGQTSVLGTLVAGMLQQNLGLQVTVRPVPAGADAGSVLRGPSNVQAYLTGWQADYPDAQDFVDLLFHTGSDANYGGYSDPQVDRLLDEAATEPKEQTRVDLYRKAERVQLQDAAIVPLWFDRQFYLVPPYVGGVVPLPSGGFDFRQAYVRKR